MVIVVVDTHFGDVLWCSLKVWEGPVDAVWILSFLRVSEKGYIEE